MKFNLVKLETKAGAAIPFNDVKIVPFSRVLQVQIPGLPGGFIWNRPVSVATISPDGSEHVLPVRDVTRQAQIALWSAVLAATLVIGLFFRVFRKENIQDEPEPTQKIDPSQ